jgi:uncharacterized RDD family membrane protein YckC
VSEIVTGEAVVVEVRVAQLPTRAMAYIIDWVVQWTVLIAAFVLVSNASFVADTALTTGLVILFTVLVIVGYPVIFETVSRGRSLGKLALGLRVVSEDGGPERFRQALFRGLAGFVEFWLFFGAPALITSLVNQQGKRLGDVFAGTIVIGERAPRQAPPPAMPPQLAAWAATLELSQLPDELANTARQYLSRWHQLAPGVQHEMGARIAAQVTACVAPPPPPGVPPHAYLSAILAERRRREEIRLGQSRQTTVPYGEAGPQAGPPLPYPAAPPVGQPHPLPPPGSAQPSPAASPYAQPAAPIPEAPQHPATAPHPTGPTPGGFVPPA